MGTVAVVAVDAVDRSEAYAPQCPYVLEISDDSYGVLVTPTTPFRLLISQAGGDPEPVTGSVPV